jgi:hypothetical protein
LGGSRVGAAVAAAWQGSILHEFVIAPLARPSLERLGLAFVGYAGLAEESAQPAFEALCRTASIPTGPVAPSGSCSTPFGGF